MGTDYTELLDRIDGHLRALRTTTYELTALADLKDDIVTLTDHVLRLREENTALGVRVQEGWDRIEELEREARRLRERWCVTRTSAENWHALRHDREPGDNPWAVAACGMRLRRPPVEPLRPRPPLTFERREPSCPNCREVLCLDPK